MRKIWQTTRGKLLLELPNIPFLYFFIVQIFLLDSLPLYPNLKYFYSDPAWSSPVRNYQQLCHQIKQLDEVHDAFDMCAHLTRLERLAFSCLLSHINLRGISTDFRIPYEHLGFTRASRPLHPDYVYVTHSVRNVRHYCISWLAETRVHLDGFRCCVIERGHPRVPTPAILVSSSSLAQSSSGSRSPVLSIAKSMGCTIRYEWKVASMSFWSSCRNAL